MIVWLAFGTISAIMSFYMAEKANRSTIMWPVLSFVAWPTVMLLLLTIRASNNRQARKRIWIFGGTQLLLGALAFLIAGVNTGFGLPWAMIMPTFVGVVAVFVRLLTREDTEAAKPGFLREMGWAFGVALMAAILWFLVAFTLGCAFDKVYVAFMFGLFLAIPLGIGSAGLFVCFSFHEEREL